MLLRKFITKSAEIDGLSSYGQSLVCCPKLRPDASPFLANIIWQQHRLYVFNLKNIAHNTSPAPDALLAAWNYLSVTAYEAKTAFTLPTFVETSVPNLE